MGVKIVKVNESERVVLDNLLQLYLHDVSLYFPMDFDSEKGTYEYDSLDKYFDGSDNYAYFLKENENILGFALIDKVENDFVVQEMFVLNNYKSKGIGETAVAEIFNSHIGSWIVKSLPTSEKAERFWNKAIKNYTKDKYSVEHVGRFNRAVFKFTNKNS